MLSKANFLFLKKGREPNVTARALCGSFQCSVTAAIAAAFAAAAAPTAAAAMLVGVPCDPAHTAKHDSTHDDRRQIKVRGEKFHHTKHTLSVQSVLLDLGDIDFDLVVTSILVGTDQQVDEADQNHSSHDGEEVEADLTSDQAAQLVHHQSGAVRDVYKRQILTRLCSPPLTVIILYTFVGQKSSVFSIFLNY